MSLTASLRIISFHLELTIGRFRAGLHSGLGYLGWRVLNKLLYLRLKRRKIIRNSNWH